MTRIVCVVVLIGVTSVIGYSQETATQYVSPSEAVPSGKAPQMQLQFLNPGEPTKQYAVIFHQGDEAFPDCWSLRRSITLRVRISPRLER